MRLRQIFALVLALFTLASAQLPLTTLSYAQDTSATDVPMPRPRPDRDPSAPDSVAPAPNTPTPATAAISALTTVPQPVTLDAKITPNGTVIPDGLVWRIFDTKPEANGELALVAKSDEGTARVTLPPGEYVVHVAYGRAQVSETMTVQPGENQKTFVLEAGALRLNAAVTGDISIPANLLTFDIYSTSEEAAKNLLTEGLAPNDIITLNAGTYHVVSRFGTINAVVRADLRVEPGQLTDATLYHHASQTSFKLVSETGGEAIADVDWTVKTAEGTTIFTELGAFPTTVLAEGDYLVLAKQGDKVFNREFEIIPGPPREIEVLTSVY